MKFLVIRLSSIGDIVLATPAIRCLKSQYPGAIVHFLTKSAFKAVSEANPHIDKFHYFDGNLGKLVKELKKEQFDMIIDLHRNLRTFIIRSRLGKPTLSYRKLSIQKLLLTRFGIDRMPDRHISRRSIDAVARLGVVDDGQGLDYFLPDGVTIPEGLIPAGIHGRYIALCIGASFDTKKLPVGQLIRLCERLDGPVVIVGGPEDMPAGDAIAHALPGMVINACGKCSLHQSALLVRDARLVISHDTGMQYIACAFQKPVLAIWGATSPKLKVEPFYGSAHPALHLNFLVPGLSCQPCSNYGTKKCPKGHFDCMNKMDLDAIAAAANR